MGGKYQMLLFYVRHGDPIYSPDQLTALGETQAQSVARRLALFGLDEIYSSPSNRAIQTAVPTCELLGKELHTLDFLNENDLNGLKIPISKEKNGWVWSHPVYSKILAERDVREMGDLWYNHPKLERFHFEKTILPINRQLDAFLSSCGYEHDSDKGLYKVKGVCSEKRIAIFAHECMGKIVMSHLLDIPFPYYAAHFEMHTSALTVIRFGQSRFEENDCQYARAQVLTLSNDAHLYKDDLPLIHRFAHIREEY